jgi:hypothetical protein
VEALEDLREDLRGSPHLFRPKQARTVGGSSTGGGRDDADELGGSLTLGLG